MAVYRRIVTGVSTMIFLVKQLCRLQTRYGAKIVAWAEANMTPTKFASFMTFYNSLSGICLILESTPDD